MIGRTLGHYRILEKIGAGGMGEVYRAHDERLDRDVALKVLPTGTLADEAARKRFRKEALALSKLNHPNIATVFDFDTQDGVDFLVMEHIAGITLDQKVSSGPLPEKEIARLGVQLAEGLAAAHEQSVVHRDLKPGNLRLTPDGRLKILDFGLAKLLQPVGQAMTESLTESGAMAGTLPYMAPEQLRGESVDARSDLYAAGVVLYEMATGRRPFEEKLSTTLTDAILNRAPVGPRALNERVSPELERVVLKCLEKEPENRYQSAKEVVVDLRRLGASRAAAETPRRRVPFGFAQGKPPGSARLVWRVGTGLAAVAVVVAVLVGLNVGGWRERLLGHAGAPRIESLAVLPLANLSGDPEQEYFADGMTEALITDLAKIGSLRVISRTSVMEYKGVKKPLPKIARELKVDAVVEGSVMRVGDRVRITVQLIHGPTDKHLWADSYERELRDVLAMQEEVARAIAQEIRIKLTPQENARLTGSRPIDPEVYELYLLGQFYSHKGPRTDWGKSQEYFERAIAKDPSYAPAYAGLARFYSRVVTSSGPLTPQEAWPKAEAAVQRALELDDRLAEAHAELANIRLLRDWNWEEAAKESQRALELNPNSPDAHSRYARYLRVAGRPDEAVREMKRALELDPLRVDLSNQLGVELVFARRYDEAIEQFHQSLELDANSVVAHFYLSALFAAKGMEREAAEEAIKGLNAAGEASQASKFERIYKASGYRAAQRFLDQRAIEDELKRPRPDPWTLAYTYPRLGQKDKAFEWLEKAYQERSVGLLQLRVDPDFDNLRSDPRYKDLVRRINFPS